MSYGQETHKEASRRHRILEAATRVFERHGLAKASMRAIAKEAGCTTGAIYPLFAGKEDIYACLLEESLQRLHGEVAKASAAQANALEGLLAAANAWYGYYAIRPFEADLGLYLHGGLKTKGLGSAHNEKLNLCLLKSLEVFEACFVRLAPSELETGDIRIWARRERDALFACLIGLLTIKRTGRDLSIGSQAQTILQTHLLALRQRFG